MDNQLGLNTRSLHNVAQDSKTQEVSHNKDSYGATRTPPYYNATFEFKSAQEIARVSKGMAYGHVYSRSSNPTIEGLESRIRGISNAMGVVATSSGMGAITLALLSLLKAGDSLLSTQKLFGHSLGLFKKTFKNLHINVEYVDFRDLESVAKALDNPKIKAIFLETINNPWLEIADLQAISALAKKHHLPLVVDSTMTPFCVFDARKYGANIEVISSTKAISGGSGGLGGLVLDYGDFDWVSFENLKEESQKAGKFAFLYKARKEIMLYLGLMANPHSAYMHTLGLETFSLRTFRACQNALEIAHFLEDKGIAVNYPALPSSPYYHLCQKQFGGYGGSVLSFELESKERSLDFMNKLQIIKTATNIYDTKSLIISPADVIYPLASAKEKEEVGITETMLRLAIGLEDSHDLKADIEQALKLA